MKYLVKTTEVYRVDSEEEAKDFIEEQKQSTAYTVTKYASEQKEQKSKGEIVDSWTRVTLVKEFNIEKEPDTEIDIEYTRNNAF